MPDPDPVAEAQAAAERAAAERAAAAPPAVPPGPAATPPPPPAAPPAPATPIVTQMQPPEPPALEQPSPSPSDATPPAPPAPEPPAQLSATPPVPDQAELEARIRAELEAEQASQAAGTAPATAPQPVVNEMPDEWPCKGYNGPQPWQVSNPPELSHDRGLISSGSAGELVVELGAMLCALGYTNEIGEGKNPHAIFGKSELDALEQFRKEFGVVEDPAITRATMPSTVGPWTWETLFRAVRSQVSADWPEGGTEG